MDIASLLDGISQEDMEKLKTTAMQFFGGDNKKEEKNETSLLNAFDPNVLKTAAKFSALIKEKDEKSDFFLALKPLLSAKRQQKADEAAMMIRFLHIADKLREEGM